MYLDVPESSHLLYQPNSSGRDPVNRVNSAARPHQQPLPVQSENKPYHYLSQNDFSSARERVK